MKIYTGTGDRGKTSLFSGERVSKSTPRIEAYGDLDELNATIGAITAALETDQSALTDALQTVQGFLLDAGAWLATTPGAASSRFLEPFTSQPAQWLEASIDQLNASLPELNHFILPGGHPAAAFAHMARTVCRRTERRTIDLLQQDENANEAAETIGHILVFLNRLSDYLFVVARHCNHVAGHEDVLWGA